MDRPHAWDWEVTENPDVIHSKQRNIYWHNKEEQVLMQREAKAAGWIGNLYHSRKLIRDKRKMRRAHVNYPQPDKNINQENS